MLSTYPISYDSLSPKSLALRSFRNTFVRTNITVPVQLNHEEDDNYWTLPVIFSREPSISRMEGKVTALAGNYFTLGFFLFYRLSYRNRVTKGPTADPTKLAKNSKLAQVKFNRKMT